MNTLSRRMVVVILLCGWVPVASAQTADEVIEKHLAAIGGRAALGKVTSRLTTGTVTLSTPGGDVAGTIELLNQAPNRQRTLIKLDLSAVGMGEMTIDQRFDGTSGIAINSMQGATAITGDQLENLKNAAFPNPFLNYKEHGAIVELAKEKIGDRDVFVLILKPKAGPVVRQSVDAQSYLSVRTVAPTEVPQMGKVDQTTEFSDFRDVDGLKIPFQITISSAAQNITVLTNKVEHNVKVDEKLFSKP